MQWAREPSSLLHISVALMMSCARCPADKGRVWTQIPAPHSIWVTGTNYFAFPGSASSFMSVDNLVCPKRKLGQSRESFAMTY